MGRPPNKPVLELNPGNQTEITFPSFGISLTNGVYSVDKIEYTSSGKMVNFASVYTTNDKTDAFDRYKIFAARELY